MINSSVGSSDSRSGRRPRLSIKSSGVRDLLLLVVVVEWQRRQAILVLP
jgi:hypothetical protein